MNFNDSNMGKYFTSQASVKVYLSYFDSNGPAVVPANAAAIRSPIPILWVVGSKDPLTRPSSYAFDKAPTHPKSKYLSVNAGHLDTPTVAAEQIILWIKALES
jgi:cephalosporin-C deacetylase-like acetyl esterase